MYNSIHDHWTDGPILSTGREISQAGLVTFSNGTKVIVAAGGYEVKSSELLVLGTSEWMYGPDLPHDICCGASVQFENTFLVVGGFHDNSYQDTIWKFDIDVGNWVIMDQKLATPRDYLAAFLVPDSFC